MLQNFAFEQKFTCTDAQKYARGIVNSCPYYSIIMKRYAQVKLFMHSTWDRTWLAHTGRESNLKDSSNIECVTLENVFYPELEEALVLRSIQATYHRSSPNRSFI